MAWKSAYSGNCSTGSWTYTRVRVDYNYPDTKATAYLLYSRTNTWADTATQVYGLNFSCGNGSVSNVTTPAFWGKTTDGEVCHCDFDISLAGGTYYPSASASANGYFNFSGSVTIPAHTYTISYNVSGWGDQTKSHGTAITLHSSKPGKSSTTENGYKVTFNANGGSTTPSALTATNTISYSFSGWYSSVTGDTHTAGSSYNGDGDVTLTAQWGSSRSYGSITLPSISKNNTTTSRTVSLDASSNGGLCGTGSLTSNATISYSLKGWYTSSSGGTHCGGAGSSYKPDKDRTLYAQWNSSTGSYSQVTLPGATKNSGEALRRLTFNATANGGSCSTPYTDTSAVITYTQTGWWTAKSGGTNRGNSGSKYTPSASETLYAQFSSSIGSYGAITLPTATKANSSTSRTITFNGNGGTTPSSQTSTATITYTQTGWFSSASGGANRGVGGAKYTPSADETVYAQFSSSIGDYSAIELPTPTRTDYVFKGWSTDPNATSGIVGSYTPPSDITLYATWVEDQAKASVKVNGSWVKGKVYYKKDGQWVKVKKVYRKIDGQWKIGRNS